MMGKTQKGGIFLEKYMALVVSFLLVLFTLCSCSVPRRQPDQTTTAEQAEDSSAPGETLYFELANLPKIGPYHDGIVYQRLTEAFVDSFQPSDQYGAVVPYVGDYRAFQSVEIEEGDECYFNRKKPRYGLMTVNGTVITDAVYDGVYMDGGLIILDRCVMENDEGVNYRTILPCSGKWSLVIDYPNGPEGNWVCTCPQYDRFFVCDGERVSGYDYSGKKLFTTAEGYYSYFWELEEPGRILLWYSNDGVNKTILLDMNGKEVLSIEDMHIELGENSNHYFTGGILEEGSDDYTKYYGVLDESGEWVIPPIYRRTQVFGDRFFACDNWFEVEITDTNGKEITRLDGSGVDAPDVKWIGGELIYDEFDYDSMRRMWYSIDDGKPIMPKGVTVLDTFFCEESGCFFGLDEGGTGYLYTRDGTVLKTFPQGISCYASNWEGMVEVNTGSEQKTTTHVIDPGTKQEVFRFVSRDAANNQEFDMGIRPKDTQRYAILTAYPIEDTNEDRLTQVYDTETDKVILDRCSVADLFIVNGKTYCAAIRNDQCVVLDQNGAVLLRMPCAYLD